MITETITIKPGDAVTWMEVAKKGSGFRLSTRQGILIRVIPNSDSLVRIRNGRRVWVVNDALRPANLPGRVHDAFMDMAYGCGRGQTVRALIGYPTAETA